MGIKGVQTFPKDISLKVNDWSSHFLTKMSQSSTFATTPRGLCHKLIRRDLTHTKQEKKTKRKKVVPRTLSKNIIWNLIFFFFLYLLKHKNFIKIRYQTDFDTLHFGLVLFYFFNDTFSRCALPLIYPPGLVGRVFANDPGDRGLIYRSGHTKDFKSST